MIIVVCTQCNKEFEKSESEYKRNEKSNQRHFCSKKCYNEYRTINSINYCKFCGNEVKSKTFCSNSCAASHNNKHRIVRERKFSNDGIKNIVNAREIKLNTLLIEYNKNPKFCIECYAILPYRNRNRKFCSIECKRKYERKNLNEYQKYYKECQFDFNLSDYPNEFDFSLIEKYGWYQAKNHGNNLNGVSRDHMISIKYGFENKISSEIIRHPANCQLMIHNENVRKHKGCSITLDELLNRIDTWGSGDNG